MSELEKAARQALEKVQEFKSRWWKVPPFGNKLNKAQREAITFAHVPVFELEDALRRALEQPAQEPVAFLANGTRFKMSFFENEDGPGTHVTCFEAFEKELDGRWVALVAAEDDGHRNLARPQAREWAGLTDEEYKQAEEKVWAVVSMDDAEKQANREFYEAIKAKLRDKNA